MATDFHPNLQTGNARLGALFEAVHAPVICAYACSKVFRLLIGRVDAPGGLSWTEIHNLILPNRNSIELFGLTRAMNPTVAMQLHDAYYGQLLAENDALWSILNRTC